MRLRQDESGKLFQFNGSRTPLEEVEHLAAAPLGRGTEARKSLARRFGLFGTGLHRRLVLSSVLLFRRQLDRQIDVGQRRRFRQVRAINDRAAYTKQVVRIVIHFVHALEELVQLVVRRFPADRARRRHSGHGVAGVRVRPGAALPALGDVAGHLQGSDGLLCSGRVQAEEASSVRGGPGAEIRRLSQEIPHRFRAGRRHFSYNSSTSVKLLFLAIALSVPAVAGEYAVLQNGFRIHAARHEVLEGVIRLHTPTGTMDLPVGQVVHFEQEEYVAPKTEPDAAAPAPETPAPAPVTPHQLVADAALDHGLRPEFVRSIAAVESAFRVDALSHKGAMGLMQLMPGTAAELGVDPKDPKQNAAGGAKYLRQLLERYKDRKDGVRLAIAAYNAGPGAVDRYGAIPPYRETQQYVEKVVSRYLRELNSN